MNLPTDKKNNSGWRKSFRTKSKNYKRGLCKVFRLWNSVRTGFGSICLDNKTPHKTTRIKRNKKRQIRSVTINFMTGLWKISM